MSRTPLFPLQKYAFDRLIGIYGSKAKAIAAYQRFANCSRSAAYERFDGSKSIHADHLLTLLAHHGLHDFDIWPEGWAAHPRHEVLMRIEDANFVPTHYHRQLLADLTALAKYPDGRLYHVATQLPQFMIKSERFLAGFLMFFELKFLAADPTFQSLRFGEAFMRLPVVGQWLDRYRDVLSAYQTVPGVELWSVDMLQGLRQKMRIAGELDEYAAPDVLPRLHECLERLVITLESVVQSGTKCIGPQPRGAAVKVYDHQHILHHSLCIGVGGASFLYTDIALHGFARSGDPEQIQRSLKQVEAVSQFGASLTDNIAARRRFFSELRMVLTERTDLPQPIRQDQQDYVG